jgi:Fungal chitosanase of glycosyl hydrolase group 75
LQNQIGSVCDEWDYAAKHCASQVAVFQKVGTSACYFTTKMAIDADGAPKAYYPGERYPANSHGCFDWLDNLNPADQHGIQGQDGAVGPAQGFVISGTALTDTHFPANDTSCYVDASSIPYVVLTGASLPVPGGLVLKKSCIVFVVDTKTGIYSGAIYADVGRAVGEASLALALMLNINPFSKKFFPKVGGGTSDRRIFHLVFPETVVQPPWDVASIQKQAKDGFDVWGGEQALRGLFPSMPVMSGPRPVVIKPPDHALADFENTDEPRPDFKGGDVPKSELESGT